jgi:hypothetical protein
MKMKRWKTTVFGAEENNLEETVGQGVPMDDTTQ